MLRSRKQQIEKLQDQLYSLKWEKADIHGSNMDPDMKAIYLNDVEYKEYNIQQELDELEFEGNMEPLRLMLAGFVIFAIGLLLYRVFA
jgi:hypothetical protein